ncbi:MAG: DUF6183 family protein [Egibacteraceae bacterium]
MPNVQSFIDAADTSALLRAVDGLCAHRQWDALVDLARRCRLAIEVGKQLWPVAMHIDYRLALEAPAAYAAAVLRPDAARFALGPLTEVAAGGHDWVALAPHIADPASAGAVAQERVIRGEDLTRAGDGIFTELPLVLADWEPSYALPRYRAREAAFPQPEATTRALGRPRRRTPHVALERDPGAKALREVVEVWITQSSGRVHTATVEGCAANAVGRLLHDEGQDPAAAMIRLAPGEALAILHWAGASGGAYGRRRGGARGRFAAWSAAAALAGLDWPIDQESLGEALAELSWFRWAPPGPEAGWILRLAVEDPVDSLAWAVSATDQRS